MAQIFFALKLKIRFQTLKTEQKLQRTIKVNVANNVLVICRFLPPLQ